MMLEFKGLTKKFGGLTALSDINFGIDEGKIVALIGPNGAGKTTLFNCLCGLLSVTQGDIVFEGKSIAGLAAHKITRRGIGRTFQIVKPFGTMTVLQNAMVGAFCRTGNFHEAREIAMKALALVHLDDRAPTLAGSLNLGQRKRLEIAKALATDPKLLLLDEVMAGLTPTEVTEMVEVVKGINQSGVTIMIIEHIMEAVMNTSHHIIVINFGKQIAEGTPEEVANNKLVQEAYFGIEIEEGGDPNAQN